MQRNPATQAGVALAAALLLTAGSAQAAMDDDRYITQHMIDSNGGYPLQVPELGRFKVTRVYLPERPQQACKVVKRSLGNLLQQGFAGGRWTSAPGVKVTVELEMHISSGSDGERQILCYGGGTGCKAEVEVEEVVAR